LKGSPDSESPELKYSKLEYASVLLRTRTDAVGRGIGFFGSEEVFLAIITIGRAMMMISAEIFGKVIFIEDIGVRNFKTVPIAAYCIRKLKNTFSKTVWLPALLDAGQNGIAKISFNKFLVNELSFSD
jgi:hypothetical protein